MVVELWEPQSFRCKNYIGVVLCADSLVGGVFVKVARRVAELDDATAGGFDKGCRFLLPAGQL